MNLYSQLKILFYIYLIINIIIINKHFKTNNNKITITFINIISNLSIYSLSYLIFNNLYISLLLSILITLPLTNYILKYKIEFNRISISLLTILFIIFTFNILCI